MQSNRPSIPGEIGHDAEETRFFARHERETLEAACARIYPTDDQPGAREAGVVEFIERYLGGLECVFASADGSGFLKIGGKDAEAWEMRIARLRQTYRSGVRQLAELAESQFGLPFTALSEERQDRVLETMSGAPKPTRIQTGETGVAHIQNISDDALPFFELLCLHTRQGMFCDPVYGGNRNRVGWSLVGFPGPRSLADTRDCTYGHADKFFEGIEWAEIIPHLRTHASPTQPREPGAEARESGKGE